MKLGLLSVSYLFHTAGAVIAGSNQCEITLEVYTHNHPYKSPGDHLISSGKVNVQLDDNILSFHNWQTIVAKPLSLPSHTTRGRIGATSRTTSSSVTRDMSGGIGSIDTHHYCAKRKLFLVITSIVI